MQFRYLGKSGTRLLNSYKNTMTLLCIKKKKDSSLQEFPALLLKTTIHVGSIL